MKWLLTLVLLTASPVWAKPTDVECGSYVLWKEARGEGVLVQRAVVDVLLHRAKKSRKSICQVAFEAGQFPYMVDGLKKVDKKFLARYKFILKVEQVLSKRFIYFNHVPHSWGKNTVRLGRLYFSQ